MKLSLILEATNRTARPLDRMRSDLAGVSRASTGAGMAIGGMSRHMDRADRSARALGRSGMTMGERIAMGARRGTSALVALERRMQLSNATMTALAVKSAGIVGGAIRGGVLTAGAAGTALAAGGLYKIVSAGIQSENFMTQLVGLESGNTGAAQKDMEWIKQFAKDTPYDLAEVTQAFISARNAGINPMNGSLMALSDSAAALNKTFDDAIGMLADAKTEQFERMREFGITPSQKDGKVMLRYVDRLGKDMVKIVNKNGAEVEQATLAILNEKFGGGGAALAKTTEGKWNAITDRLSQRAVKVWEGGFGAEVERQLDRVTKAFDEAEANGSADRWTNTTSQGLKSVVQTIGDADWEGFSKDVNGIAGAFGEVANLVGQASGKLSEFRKWMAQFENKADNYTGFLGSLEYRDGGLVYNAPAWAKSWSSGRSGFAPYKSKEAKAAAEQMKMSDPNAVPFIDASKPQASRDEIWRGALRNQNRAAPALSKPQPAPQPKPQAAKVSLHVTADRGLSVRTTKLQATNMVAEVQTGRAMNAIA